ncbi:MAG: TIGR01777 family protein [Coriobacteriia bacterium]|nr:TIGR01777 family protein [Coriobacteriia bacterium]
MRIAIAGGTGFIGRELTRQLIDARHDIVWLSRCPGRVRELGFDPDTLDEELFNHRNPDGAWRAEVAAADTVVNLSGHPIASRWNAKVKHLLRESRVGTNQALVSALAEAARIDPDRPRVFVSASGVGIYGDRGDELLGESSEPGADWLATLACEWEASAREAERSSGTRVVCIRTGLVLGEEGLIPRLALPMRLFVGGPVGSGRQWATWIHVEDVAAIYRHAIESPQLAGPVNACAPDPVRMRDLAATLGRAMGRPSWLPIPGIALKLVLGEVAPYMLYSQRAEPRALDDTSFTYRFPELEAAMADVVGRRG